MFVNNQNATFPTQFCFESISNGYSATKSREGSLNLNVYNFSVEQNYIKISKVLNIHKYLMTKNNMK